MNKIVLLLFGVLLFAKVDNLKCKPIKGTPVLMSDFSTPLVVTRDKGYKVTLYDKFLKVLWNKKVNAKINAVKIIGDNIYLIGSKNGKMWVAKMNIYGKLLKEKVFYTSAQGFDLVKNGDDIAVVGYKWFDHLGDYIKRFVIVLLDKDLNFIADRAYGDTDGVGIKAFKVGEYVFSVIKFQQEYIFTAFNKYGFLRWHKALQVDKEFRIYFYDVKFLNPIFFSTDMGVFVLNSDDTIAKYRDYTNVIKIIDINHFITDSGIIEDDELKNFKDIEIIDGMYNYKNYYFIGFDNKSGNGVVCKY